MNKAIIHIGASYLQEDTLIWAKKAGLYLVATDINPDADCKNIADEFYNISGTDHKSLLKLSFEISKKFELVGVYSNSDFSLKAAAEINEAHNLKGCFPNSLNLSINKVAAKKAMIKNGVPVPKGIEVENNAFDLRTFNLKLPVIVKPIDSSGSQGVMYVQNISEIESAIDNASKFSSHVMIEEYVSGDGIDCIGIMNNGKFHPYGIGYRIFSDHPYCFPVYGYTNPNFSKSDQMKAYNITESAAISLGIRNGPVKSDLIYDGEDFITIEVTPRFHGDVFSNKMIVYATGIYPTRDLYNFFITNQLPEESILDIDYKCILWKGLFPLDKGFDISILKNQLPENSKILDFFIDSRFSYSDKNHVDNTSLMGFAWFEFDSVKNMKAYLNNLKKNYGKLLL